MPMRELVVPAFREAGAPERDETPLRSTPAVVCLPEGPCFTSGSMSCPGGADEGPELRPGSWIPLGGGFVGQSE